MMNPYLADILVSNLLSNAIKYNVENGKMKITFSENALTFANSGTPMSVDGHTVFERFRKGQSKAGIGMGLSIVKRIADFYHFQPSYKYEDGMHYFTICFNGLKQDLGTGALS
jgi:signal transduction histidine kinase